MNAQQRKTRQALARIARAVINELRDDPPVTQRLFTVKDAGVYLGRSVRSIQTLIHIGTLPVVHIDSRTFLDRREIDKLIDRSTV